MLVRKYRYKKVDYHKQKSCCISHPTSSTLPTLSSCLPVPPIGLVQPTKNRQMTTFIRLEDLKCTLGKVLAKTIYRSLSSKRVSCTNVNLPNKICQLFYALKLYLSKTHEWVTQRHSPIFFNLAQFCLVANIYQPRTIS